MSFAAVNAAEADCRIHATESACRIPGSGSDHVSVGGVALHLVSVAPSARTARLLPVDAFPHSRKDLRARRHESEKCGRAAVDYDIAIHDDFEIAVAAAKHIYVCLQLPAKSRRHTG